MITKLLLLEITLVTLLLNANGALALSPDASSGNRKTVPVTHVNVLEARSAAAAGLPVAKAFTTTPITRSIGTSQLLSASNLGNGGPGGLPLWTFKYRAARDGLNHIGSMVGTNPFTNPQPTSVPAYIVPVVLKIHSLVTAIDFTTGAMTTVPGNYTESPVAADDVCLRKPNDVPVTLLRQSPLFQSTKFTFGGAYLGNTQYIDAFQRGNFLGANADVADAYHLRMAPVSVLPPVVIDVPASEGVAIDNATIFGAPTCGTLTYVDIYWFDSYLNDQVLPALASQGVGPSNLPIFILYNTVEGAPAFGFSDCCDLGYHSYGGFPTPTQTYSVTEFDTTQLFQGGPNNDTFGFSDVAVTSHELGEWANDPFGINLVPAWGGTGQVSGCQNNLEVGDPLTGTTLPSVTMPNGFTYHLQELAFFSWYFGGPSLGVNGWYSNNGSFATDAGAPCLVE